MDQSIDTLQQELIDHYLAKYPSLEATITTEIVKKITLGFQFAKRLSNNLSPNDAKYYKSQIIHCNLQSIQETVSIHIIVSQQFIECCVC